MKRLLASAAIAAFTLAVPVNAQDMAIVNATVVIGDGGEPIRGGSVVVRGGKVIAAGAGVAVPAGIEAIDAQGRWVTPGLVAAITDLGLVDVDQVGESNDYGKGNGPFGAALDAASAINPSTQPIAVSRAGGVTRAAVVPAANNTIFAGQGAVIDLAADPQAITRARVFQYVELGEAGANEAGGSRLTAQAHLRNALREAQELAGGKRREDVLLTNLDTTSLVPVVKGEQPLYVHVDRAADIRMALGLKREFPALRLVIVGANEGWLAAAEIAAAGVPVIAHGLVDLPGNFEDLAATQSNVGRMATAGVKVALGTFRDNDQPRYAPQYAGNLVALTRLPGASGLNWGQAFAAISSVPAEILGMGERIGSLRPGRAADVVIWDGDPLEGSSGVLAVYIDGVAQPLVNHQTKLRDRYRTPNEGALPKAYDW